MGVKQKSKLHMRHGMTIILAGAMLATMLPVAAFAATGDAYQQKVDQAASEYKAQSQALDDAQDKTSTAKSKVSSLNKESQAIVAQIADLDSQIDSLNQQIADLEQQIAEKEQQNTEKQASYDGRMADFKQRLAGMQELHDNGTIAMLGSVDNLYQLLTFAEMLQDMSAKDTQILDGLQAEKQALQDAKAALDADKATLEQSLTDLQAKQDALEGKKTELAGSIKKANAALSEAQADEAAQEAITEESKKKWDKALAEQEAYIRSQLKASAAGSAASLTCGLSFRNPLDSYTYISTNFGDIDNWHSKAHGGTDFAAPKGTPIHAAESGIVILAGSSSSYGNYVVVNHGTAPDGNTYATLYAHMTSYCVGAGQSVSRGDVIGYVGSTGRSTGNHLHLELWQNNIKINALGYIPA